MNKIQKFFKTLPEKIRKKLETEITAILSGNLDKKDIFPIKGRKGYFRVRKNMFRILFLNKENYIGIVKVEKRSDTTYNF